MSSQYRIVPPALSTPTTSQTQATLSQTTELGVHDAMRYGLRTVRSEIMPTHPLENRLKNVRSILDAVFLGRLDIETTRRVWHPLESDFLQWSQTQENLKLQFARDVYGIHAPIRLQMEKHLVSQGKTFSPFLPQTNLSKDILAGTDDSIEFEDFLGDPDLAPDGTDVHVQMEKGLLNLK